MMFSQIQLAGAVAASLWLAACVTRAPPTPNLEEGLAGETPNHVVVEVSTMTHVLTFPADAVEPDPTAVSELNDFLSLAGANSGASVLIERSISPADDDRTAILSGSLRRKGLRTTVRVAPVAAGALRLTIKRYTASAPGCPNWSKKPGNDFANTLPSDFGCSTAANLAAMISDPRDLNAGSDMSLSGGDASVAPLQRYRAGRVSPLSIDGAGAPGVHASPGAGSSS